MYATKDEQIKIAHDAWASAESTRNSLQRKLDKARSAAETAPIGAEYATAVSLARLIEVQHAAVAQLASDRWDHLVQLNND